MYIDMRWVSPEEEPNLALSDYCLKGHERASEEDDYAMTETSKTSEFSVIYFSISSTFNSKAAIEACI
jgi:hypothetical protein